MQKIDSHLFSCFYLASSFIFWLLTISIDPHQWYHSGLDPMETRNHGPGGSRRSDTTDVDPTDNQLTQEIKKETRRNLER
ncbi:hypothetical protein HanPSC8_Chr06g0250831 [Helianthus annuus]|nr:hypothetical protein HanPSC8_Chr06g0250831 [Helianthus annuus]